MGGIPRQSRGCGNCKERKIKCDLQRPYCSKCARGGLACKGYVLRPEDRHFISFQTSAPATKTTKLKQKQDPAGIKLYSQPKTLPKRHGESITSLRANMADATTLCTVGTSWQPVSPSPRDINNLPATRTQIMSTFLEQYLINEECLFTGFWSKTFPALLGRCGALDSAIYAYCCTYLAKTNHDEQLTRQSVSMYVHAVEKMASVAKEGMFNAHEDALAVNVFLTKFEMLDPFTSEFGWESHMAGGLAILRLRGPPSAQKPIHEGLWRLVRLCAIVYAMLTRKGLFLAEPEWRNVWIPGVFTNVLASSFLDLAVNLPSLCERLDCLESEVKDVKKNGGAEKRQMCQNKIDSLQFSCCVLNRNLEAFFREFLKSDEKLSAQLVGTEDSVPKIVDSPSIEPFTPLVFSCLVSAQLYVWYCASTLVIYKTILQLRSLSRELTNLDESSQLPISPHPHMPADGDVYRHTDEELGALMDFYAAQVCRSCDFLFDPATKGVGPLSVLFPLHVAQQHFLTRASDFDCKEKNKEMDGMRTGDEIRRNYRWCENRFKTLERRGFTFGLYMSKLAIK